MELDDEVGVSPVCRYIWLCLVVRLRATGGAGKGHAPLGLALRYNPKIFQSFRTIETIPFCSE